MEPQTSFWANPENNSLKVILIVILVAVAGFFAFKYMQKDSLSGKGAVISYHFGTEKRCTILRGDGTLEGGNWNTAGGCCDGDKGGACVKSGASVLRCDPASVIDVGGRMQCNPESKATLVDAEGNPVATEQGDLVFSQLNEGNTCTLTISNAVNLDQSITVAGMLAADGEDCIPNAKQDNQISQGMADAMNGGVSVKE